ncbi:phospholipase [Herbiconiux sp. KACC 21604]|uniref:aggregation-promoting factor C-terminal-like domain-containing protein n=1 Tax=unclassified Herbiconiux TaxID=2618217 RepID=UPI0020A344D5|nr:phospholipase [Herbiconiux sp. SALV-R1]WPO88085.1 phospholipase [Herbiconiux sp. KACC 21604]
MHDQHDARPEARPETPADSGTNPFGAGTTPASTGTPSDAGTPAATGTPREILAGYTGLLPVITDTGTIITLPTAAEPPRLATRRELRRHRRSRSRAVVAPIAGIAAAGLLVTLAGFAHPSIANAATPSGVIASTPAAVTAAVVEAQPDAIFARTADRADARAAVTLAEANTVLQAAKGKVDTQALVTSVAALANYRYLDTTTVQSLTNTATTATSTAKAEVAAVDKAAADAAAAEAAAAAAAAQAEAERLAAANTPDGARAVAADMAAEQYGWGADQFQCLDSLWTKESGWNYQAENASSGAYGIPQSLPGSKMATIADDWATNAVTQISWGLNYIARGYGTPCSAWSHSQSVNWY